MVVHQAVDLGQSAGQNLGLAASDGLPAPFDDSSAQSKFEQVPARLQSRCLNQSMNCGAISRVATRIEHLEGEYGLAKIALSDVRDISQNPLVDLD